MNDRDKETISYIILFVFLAFSLIIFCCIIYQLLPNPEIVHNSPYNFPPATD